MLCDREIKGLRDFLKQTSGCEQGPMFDLLGLCFGLPVRVFHSRGSLRIENLALR
jgi:hypothetical protein